MRIELFNSIMIMAVAARTAIPVCAQLNQRFQVLEDVIQLKG